LPKSVERLGRRRPEGQPRSLGQLVLSTTDTLSRFDQRRQFVWREFAEAFEVGATGKRPDADERDRRRLSRPSDLPPSRAKRALRRASAEAFGGGGKVGLYEGRYS
jgi:hypothetical protein